MKFFTLDDLSEIIVYKISDNVSEYQFLYNFISVNKDFILQKCNTFSEEDLWYSEYYWLLCEKYFQFKKSGYDAGMEQMIFNLLETISNNIEIDWSVIKDLDMKAKNKFVNSTDV